MTSKHRTTTRVRTLLLTVGALSLFLTSLSGAATARESAPKAHGSVRAGTKTEGSLYMVTFKTPQGRIHVYLPADMRPGDALVGSTVLEPAGKQDADKDGNRGRLAAYSLSFGGQTHPLQEPTLRWNLPADLKPEAAVLILTDPSQQEAARQILPLREVGGTASPNSSRSDKVTLPTKGNPGRPITLNLPFLGAVDDLHVLVGGKEARLLAASPRVFIVESPGEAKGKTTLQVKRGENLLAEGKFSNSRVSGGNPWPYIIVVLVGIGVYIAVQAAQFAQDFGHNFGSGGIF